MTVTAWEIFFGNSSSNSNIGLIAFALSIISIKAHSLLNGVLGIFIDESVNSLILGRELAEERARSSKLEGQLEVERARSSQRMDRVVELTEERNSAATLAMKAVMQTRRAERDGEQRWIIRDWHKAGKME